MSRFLLLIVIFFSLQSQIFAANAEYWQKSGEIKLKKDQKFKILLNINNETKDIIFHWTLYKNGGLVTLVKYDSFPYQFILSKEYQLEGFKLKLLSSSSSYSEAPFMLLTFKDFDRKNKEATLEFKFHSPKQQLEITY